MSHIYMRKSIKKKWDASSRNGTRIIEINGLLFNDWVMTLWTNQSNILDKEYVKSNIIIIIMLIIICNNNFTPFHRILLVTADNLFFLIITYIPKSVPGTKFV